MISRAVPAAAEQCLGQAWGRFVFTVIISKIRLMDKDLQKIRMIKILFCVGLYVSVDSYCIQMSRYGIQIVTCWRSLPQYPGGFNS